MHLTDCFIEVVAYVAHFKRSVAREQPAYEQVRADVVRLLKASEDRVKKDAFSQEDYDQARFMVCAWTDETILGSEWEYKSQWQTEQLQRLYYSTVDAGEQVFTRLNALGPHQREVKEVYYLCLSLGFMGRYIHKGDEYLLQQVQTSLLRELLGSSVGIPSLEKAELFPEALRGEEIELDPSNGGRTPSMFTLVCLAGPLVLLLVLFSIYGFSLSLIG